MAVTYALPPRTPVMHAPQTLMDPCRRETYDDLVGFSDAATNPFHDATPERDLVGRMCCV